VEICRPAVELPTSGNPDADVKIDCYGKRRSIGSSLGMALAWHPSTAATTSGPTVFESVLS